MGRLIMLSAFVLLMCSHKPQIIYEAPACPQAIERRVTEAGTLEDKEIYNREEVREFLDYVRKKLLLKEDYVKQLEEQIKCLEGE